MRRLGFGPRERTTIHGRERERVCVCVLVPGVELSRVRRIDLDTAPSQRGPKQGLEAADSGGLFSPQHPFHVKGAARTELTQDDLPQLQHLGGWTEKDPWTHTDTPVSYRRIDDSKVHT